MVKFSIHLNRRVFVMFSRNCESVRWWSNRSNAVLKFHVFYYNYNNRNLSQAFGFAKNIGLGI